MHSLLHPAARVPAEYRKICLHLYLDIAWFGVLAASASSFVAVYATHQGASPLEIGLLTAGPAAVNLLLTLPAGRWLETRPMHRAVFWTAACSRIFYLLWVPLPWLLAPAGQVWALIGMTLVMSIPATALAVGFNALYAEAIPTDLRGHVVGVRNALLSIIIIIVSLLCAQILDRLPFPTGYQVVFGIGFVGAAMSTLHLRFVVPLSSSRTQPQRGQAPGGQTDRSRTDVGLRLPSRPRLPHLLNLQILRGPFGKLVAVLFIWHLAVNLVIPLYPAQWVRQIHLSDREIGLGNAVFYVGVFAGSTQLAKLVRRFSNQRVTALGGVLMASYPIFMGLAKGLDLFLVGSAGGGLGWALVSGALLNYILEKIPEDRRPAHLAWYNLVANAALLLSSLLGPAIGGIFSLPAAMLIGGAVRLLAALLILLWER